MRTIRLMTAAGGILLGLAASAAAADLGYGMKDEAVAYPALWQGRYVGVSIGATGNGADVHDFGQHNKLDIAGSSFSGGVLVGYNFRSGSWVGGFEADLNGAAYDKSKNIDGLGKLTLSSNGYGSLRVRGGYAFDKVLVYATGGIGFTEYSIKSSLGGDHGMIFATPVLGVGAEFALDRDWTARVEALAFGSGGADVTLAGAKHEVDFGYSAVRLGLTRRF